MTTASTGVAAVVTPTLVKVLAGSLVELDAWGLVKSTLQVVMGPVGLGLLINRYV
jgi:BASS family bile acid:Na+ symporter